MTWLVAVIKSIHLARVLLKRRQLLHRYYNMHESKNQGELNRKVLYKSRFSLIIQVVLTGPGAKSFGSKLSLCFVLSEAWWARFSVLKLLCSPSWYLFYESSLRDSLFRDCWVLLFSLLSGSKQSLLKWPSFWQL